MQELINALDLLVDRSYSATTKNEFELLLNSLKKLSVHSDANYLMDAVRSAILLNKRAQLYGGNEFILHREFERNISDLLPGWRIARRKNDPRHIPDFWVESGNEVAPVEIKREVFTAASLRQLARYMNFYSCAKGFAAAPRLECALPGNVIFVPLS